MPARLYRLCLFMFLLVPVAGAGPAAAQEVSRLPPSIVSDGRITMEELEEHSQAVYRALDKDSDGLIARGEFVDFPLTRTAAMTEAGRMDVFDFMDSDGDGTIHRGEWEVAIDKGVQLADLDGDGYVSLSELVAMNEAGTLTDAIPAELMLEGIISRIF